jgi:hypothetical protein
MTDRDTTTRTRARAPGVGGVFHRMAVHDRVLRPDSERTTVATTKCTKSGCKLDGGRRMPGAGLSRRSPRKAPLGQSAFQPYWGKLAVRNDRGDRGNVGIIRSPIRASILPDLLGHEQPVSPYRTHNSSSNMRCYFSTTNMVLGIGKPMKRRDFIALLGSVAAGWPRAAPAQQSSQRIGILTNRIRCGTEGPYNCIRVGAAGLC